jgi:hypothetical protein
VRDGSQQGRFQLVRLRQRGRVGGFLAQTGTFQSQRCLVDECRQRLLIFGSEDATSRPAGHFDNARYPVFGHDRQIEGIASISERNRGHRNATDDPAAATTSADRFTVLHCPLGQRKTCAIDLLANLLGEIRDCAQLPVLSRHQDPAPLGAVDGHNALGDARQDGLEGDVPDQGRVQFCQHCHATSLAQGLLGALSHPGDQPRGDDGYTEIDEERQHMVWRSDGEGQVGGNEKHVEGKESKDRAEHSRPKAPVERQEERQYQINKEYVEDTKLIPKRKHGAGNNCDAQDRGKDPL